MRKRYVVIGRKTALLCFVLLLFAIGGSVHGMNRMVRVNSAAAAHPIYSVDTPEPLVSLGINCAWDNEDIPALLEILERDNVRATFFVVGQWCDKYPESVRMIHDAGHEIGSHSDTHADMTKLSRDDMILEIRNSAAKIEAVTGVKVDLYRPPSGAYNSKAVQTIKDEGMYPIQWDCDSMNIKAKNIDLLLHYDTCL